MDLVEIFEKAKVLGFIPGHELREITTMSPAQMRHIGDDIRSAWAGRHGAKCGFCGRPMPEANGLCYRCAKDEWNFQ
jgi:hypothetical protein